MKENMIVTNIPKLFVLSLMRYLKYEIEFIIKSKEPLAENKIKNEIEQLLLKYNHGYKIYEHGKQ